MLTSSTALSFFSSNHEYWLVPRTHVTANYFQCSVYPSPYFSFEPFAIFRLLLNQRRVVSASKKFGHNMWQVKRAQTASIRIAGETLDLTLYIKKLSGSLHAYVVCTAKIITSSLLIESGMSERGIGHWEPAWAWCSATPKLRERKVSP